MSRGLDLTSDEFKNLPDGTYKLTIAASNDGPSAAEQSISYDFRVDTKLRFWKTWTWTSGMSSVLPSAWRSVMSRPIAGFTVHDPGSGLWFYRDVVDNTSDQWFNNGRYYYNLSLALGELESAWAAQGGTGDIIAHPYVMAWDYGLNHSEAVTIRPAFRQ